MISKISNAVAFTDIRWPVNPFHKGEIALQQVAGVQEHVMSYAPKFVRKYLPDQHRDFYGELPFVVGAARDETGTMWSTLFEKTDMGSAHFITSPNDKTLHIQTQPVPGDALQNAFSTHTITDLGLLGIMLETKRRNRVNGRAVADSNTGGLIFTVDQAFGNCPQYIKPRSNWYQSASNRTDAAPLINNDNITKRIFASELTTDQIQWITSAETVFTASGYRGEGENERFGNDASHRGGAPGFVRVDSNTEQQQQTISWIEYPGNNHFNTLGNIVLDPRVGISIPNFATGGLLQVSGTATVEMGELKDGGRKVYLSVTAVNELPAGALPIRWAADESAPDQTMQVIVSKIVQESEDVKSFYFEAADPVSTLPSFRAGQHLPIELTLDDGKVLKRTYSLSAAPSTQSYYRISVKKQKPDGKASSFLHNHFQVGDSLTVGQPAGDFVRATPEKGRTTVLLSSGIGVTPILSMLHEVAGDENTDNNEVVWLQGARNGRHHALQQEVDSMLQRSSDSNDSSIKSRIFYSQPDPKDDRHDVTGRITPDEVGRLVPDWKEAVYYMCGPAAFLADLESGLEVMGVSPKNIHFETF